MASSSSSAVILNNSQSSLMASSLPRTWRYRVFTSFHGPDVRKTFLSHLRKEFDNKGIRMFDDQGIERGHTIAPDLIEAIRQSRISIVVLSKNYASSSWCLDELVEILDCKETMGKIVMTVFYDVDPSHVRNQTEDFGRVFKETCERKTEEDKQRWSQALNYVGTIAGEHFQNWNSEAKMIEKIARDVSDKLKNTPSRDFDGMVGLEAHMGEMWSLLDLDSPAIRTEHLCIFDGVMPEVSNETKFEFRTESEDGSLLDDYDIIECGVRIITEERKISSEVYGDLESENSYEIIECGVRFITDEREISSEVYDDLESENSYEIIEREISSEDYNDSSYDSELDEVLEDTEDRVINCDSKTENVEKKKASWCSLIYPIL